MLLLLSFKSVDGKSTDWDMPIGLLLKGLYLLTANSVRQLVFSMPASFLPIIPDYGPKALSVMPNSLSLGGLYSCITSLNSSNPISPLPSLSRYLKTMRASWSLIMSIPSFYRPRSHCCSETIALDLASKPSLKASTSLFLNLFSKKPCR